MSVSGRVIALTGAASGIGRALALELARRGADLALADVDEVGLERCRADVAALGRAVTARRVDVARREEVDAFARAAILEHGRVDGVVNNAGVSLTGDVCALGPEDLEWIVGINLWGVIHGTQAFLPHLLERDTGWVVNLSSLFGLIAVPGQAAYNATKFAVRGFTEALRMELAGTGITVVCVHPGGVRTGIVRNGRVHAAPGQEDHATLARLFEERLARTRPEDAARAIADGMVARRARVLIGADARLLDLVQRLAPVGYATLLAKARRLRGRS